MKFDCGSIQFDFATAAPGVRCVKPQSACLDRPVVLQISNIRIIKEAMREASFLYAELVALGATMGILDVGGELSLKLQSEFTACAHRDTIPGTCILLANPHISIFGSDEHV